jgi:hypothetical protein
MNLLRATADCDCQQADLMNLLRYPSIAIANSQLMNPLRYPPM